MKTRLAAVTCALAGALTGAAPARGQGVSGSDSGETARFAAIVRAATRAGYAHPIVVGHGEGTFDALFALLATRDTSGVLIALVEPTGTAPARPIVLEHDRTPAGIGLRGIQFTAFLGAPGLIDVEAAHEPFMLETSRRFATHHVLRRRGALLEPACEFPGNDVSSSSKGIGSVTSGRHVAVERVPGGATLRFLVRTTDETTERSPGHPAPVTTAHSEATRQYDLPSTGPCHER